MKTPIRFLFTLLCAAIVTLPSVHATTYTVQDTGDGAATPANCPGSGCRLRDALAKVVDSDVIDFSVTTPATITLNSGQLEVSKSIMINGPGANLLTVDANKASRVFVIDSGKTVTIFGLTITNGSDSSSVGGGGILNDHANLTVNFSSLSGNSAVEGGGGIYNDGFASSSATLTVNNSTLSGNSSGNSVAPSDGGGIYNDGGQSGSATLTVNNSTLSGNSGASGGGIFNNGFNGSGTLTVNNSTLSGNSASGEGGGIDNLGTATLTIGSTILNAGASGGNITNLSGTVTSNGYNLSSDAAGGDGTTGPGGLLNATGDIRNTNPMLGALANNGGPTFTYALCTASGVPDASCTGASPAIDQGKNFTTPLATTDQRGTGFTRTVNLGLPRPTGGDGTDIGAFEVQAIVSPQPGAHWKNNPAAWPASALPMTLGSQSYTKTELLAILKTPIKGDASLMLAHQLIAAKLNIANGANGTPVTSTITHANFLLSGFNGTLPYKVKPSSPIGQAMLNDANVLNNFNSGLL